MKFELNDKFLLRASIVIFCFVLLMFAKAFYNQNSKLDTYYQLNKAIIDKYTKEKDSIIKIKNQEINDLLELNKKKQILIDRAFIAIDSLQKEKDKIKIVYKKRKGDIQELTNEELQKYWENEIK